jgi:hypothetical protein
MGCVPFPGRLYEQHLNAAGAQDLGVPVIKSLKKKHLQEALHIHFPDNTEKIIDLVLAMPVVKAVATMPAKSLPAKGILLPRWI